MCLLCKLKYYRGRELFNGCKSCMRKFINIFPGIAIFTSEDELKIIYEVQCIILVPRNYIFKIIVNINPICSPYLACMSNFPAKRLSYISATHMHRYLYGNNHGI